MNIRVLGSTGMLGREVMHSLEEHGYSATRLGLLPTKEGHGPSYYLYPPKRIETLTMDDLDKCDVLINCAGIVKQKLTTDHDMVLVNALGPHRLAELARHTGTRIIHVSTDCVFSDEGPHHENSSISPADVYGKSKAAGELAAPHLTLRTSFIGWAERGLLWDVMHQKSIEASSLFHWNGHTARTVANIIAELVPLNLTGLLHLPGEWQTRYELVKRLSEAANRPIHILNNPYPMDRRLDSNWFDLLGIKVPTFDHQLEMLMKARPE